MIKRERPTVDTAHKFHKEGFFSTGPEHRLSKEERYIEIEKIEDGLMSLVKSQYPRTQNLEYAILKAHLIVEYAVTQYIRCFSRTWVDEKQIRFTFSQKVEVAYLLGMGANEPTLLPTIERLNKLRNQVAHSFQLDRSGLDEIHRVNSEDYEEFKIGNDRERIRRLKWICLFVCGYIAGHINAFTWWDTQEKSINPQSPAPPPEI